MADTDTKPAPKAKPKTPRHEVVTEHALVSLFERPRGEIKRDLAAGTLQVRAVLGLGSDRVHLIDLPTARKHYLNADPPGALTVGLMPTSKEVSTRLRAMRKIAPLISTFTGDGPVEYLVLHPGSVLLDGYPFNG